MVKFNLYACYAFADFFGGKALSENKENEIELIDVFGENSQPSETDEAVETNDVINDENNEVKNGETNDVIND